MQLCSDCHPEVAYEEESCPACDIRHELEEMTEEKEGLEESVDTLEKEVESLKEVAEHYETVKEYIMENHPDAEI